MEIPPVEGPFGDFEVDVSPALPWAPVRVKAEDMAD
jgi:hypothetical protein